LEGFRVVCRMVTHIHQDMPSCLLPAFSCSMLLLFHPECSALLDISKQQHGVKACLLSLRNKREILPTFPPGFPPSFPIQVFPSKLFPLQAFLPPKAESVKLRVMYKLTQKAFLNSELRTVLLQYV
jgi:hypothetical protein